MKQFFSTKWASSKQPRKQRKFLANAPAHIKRKIITSNLSRDLRKKYNIRSIGLRKNDEVKVMRGEYYKKQGKVSAINKRKMKVAIEGIQVTKKDGTKVNFWLHPSNLQIINLNTDDKKRLSHHQDKDMGVKENVHNKK